MFYNYCCCQVASVMSDSMQPHRRQPTRLLCPWGPPGKNTGVGCNFLLQCMKVKSESEVFQLCPTLSDPMDYRLPGSSVHGIFQAKYWSGVPLLMLFKKKKKIALRTFPHYSKVFSNSGKEKLLQNSRKGCHILYS